MPEPTDASFVRVPTDEATGRRAWGLTQPEVEALTPKPERAPAVLVDQAASQLLKAWEEVDGERGGVLGRLSEGEQALVAAALDRLPRRCHAAHFVYGQLLVSDPTRRSKPLLEEGVGLKGAGLYWTERLEALGVVPAGRTAAIRAGSGHMDLARDLQALATELEPRMDVVEALQQLQQAQGASGAPALTRADVARMEVVGTQLVALLSGQDRVRPWHAELIGVLTLLEQDWKLIHDAWTYHRSRSGGAAPPTFHALGRR